MILSAWAGGDVKIEYSGTVPPAAAAAVQESCAGCHSMPAQLSHPVGVLYGGTTILPLEAGNRIGCSTCHETTEGATHGEALRLPPGQLCQECHAGEVDPAGAATHGLYIQRAHLGKVERPSPGLDFESRQCLGCHDGSAASAADTREYRPTRVGGARSSDLEGEHPIGVEYDDGFRGRRAPQLRPRGSLPDSMRLFEGRVGCGSCHSVYSARPTMLAVDMTGSRLCLTCHIK